MTSLVHRGNKSTHTYTHLLFYLDVEIRRRDACLAVAFVFHMHLRQRYDTFCTMCMNRGNVYLLICQLQNWTVSCVSYNASFVVQAVFRESAFCFIHLRFLSLVDQLCASFLHTLCILLQLLKLKRHLGLLLSHPQ